MTKLSPRQREVLGAFANPHGEESFQLKLREQRMGRGRAAFGLRQTLRSLIRLGLISWADYKVTEKGRQVLADTTTEEV